MKAKANLKENVKYRLVDKEGNVKSLFKANKLGRFILRALRQFVSPYDSKGQVKTDLLSRLALYGVRLPLITGVWVKELHISNLITNTGKAFMAARINDASALDPMTYIAVGTGTTAANASDTALGSEISDSGLSRASATVSRTTTDTSLDTAQLVHTFTASGSKAVTESGVFNAASSGIMLCRQVFSAINVISGDTLEMTWKIDVD